MQGPDGSLYTTAPGTQNHLPDQNMAAISALGDYYLYTGDSALVTELYPKVASYIKQFVSTTTNSDGMQILPSGGGVWNWIDWGTNLDVQSPKRPVTVESRRPSCSASAIERSNVCCNSGDA